MKTSSLPQKNIEGIASSSDSQFLNNINDIFEIKSHNSFEKKTSIRLGNPQIDDKFSIENDNELDFQYHDFLKSYPSSLQYYYDTKTQNWLGHIVEINDEGFTARLNDLTNPGTVEIGEFDLDDISGEDIPLAKPGAAFYWSLGFIYENGQKSKKSLIRFQRIVDFSEEDSNRALDRAIDLTNNIKWE